MPIRRCLKMRAGKKGIDVCVLLIFEQKPYIVPLPLMHIRLSVLFLSETAIKNPIDRLLPWELSIYRTFNDSMPFSYLQVDFNDDRAEHVDSMPTTTILGHRVFLFSLIQAPTDTPSFTT
jgi:hypothetical protein